MPTNKKGYWNKKRANGKTNYEHYCGTTKAKKDRNGRNVARRRAEKAGKVKKGDGKDIDHKNRNPRDNRKSNLRVVSRKANRGKLNPKAHKKKRKSKKK